MKKLFYMTMMLLVAAGCSRDEATLPGGSGNDPTVEPPHFYGMAMLENPAPQTRGVAVNLKVWSRPAAQRSLSVKFINVSSKTESFVAFVKDVVKEWEKAGGVRFHFVDNDQDALIRVGFDYVRSMRTSWALTGNDHLEVYDKQTEPTVHFADWPRIADAKKRSDVLRAFGQVLGLELEFRHPRFSPGWVTIEGTDQIDEEMIKEYWMYELADYISWEELKTMVLDPISYSAEQITHTRNYDSLSVMNWPFYEQIANNLKISSKDEDYNTQLSEQDKEFIVRLYGEPLGNVPQPEDYLPLIEFDYTGTAPVFTVTTTKRLVVIWDNEADECTYVDIPEGATGPYTATLSHTFAEGRQRHITIGEMLEYGQAMPETSQALTAFDFTRAAGAEQINVSACNLALEKVWIRGGREFVGQTLDFSQNRAIKELYLIDVNQSSAQITGCENLEILATHPTIWKPARITGPQYAIVNKEPMSPGSNIYETSGPIAKWPVSAETLMPPLYPSLNNVNMRGCGKLKTLSLDNTSILKLDLNRHSLLDYILLTTDNLGIVGGGIPYGQHLLNAVYGLPDRTGMSPGVMVIRAVRYVYTWDDAGEPQIHGLSTSATTSKRYIGYTTVLLNRNIFDEINRVIRSLNWIIVWETGCNVITD